MQGLSISAWCRTTGWRVIVRRVPNDTVAFHSRKRGAGGRAELTGASLWDKNFLCFSILFIFYTFYFAPRRVFSLHFLSIRHSVLNGHSESSSGFGLRISAKLRAVFPS